MEKPKGPKVVQLFSLAFPFCISINFPSDKNLTRKQNSKTMLFKQKYLGKGKKKKKHRCKSEQTIYLIFQKYNILQPENRNLIHRQEKQPGVMNCRMKWRTETYTNINIVIK